MPENPESEKQKFNPEEAMPFAEEQAEYFLKNREQASQEYDELTKKEAEYQSVLNDIDRILNEAQDKEEAKKIIEEKYKPLAQQALREVRKIDDVLSRKYPGITMWGLTTITKGLEQMRGKTKEEIAEERKRENAHRQRMEEIEDMFEIWNLSGQ